MPVRIWYCRTCGFEPLAREIATNIERELGLPTELKSAFWGTFRIDHAGREVFNRWKNRGWMGRIGCGTSPTPNEILELLRTPAASV